MTTNLAIDSIAVLAGGESSEREVSLRSGAAVAAALRRMNYHTELLDPRDPEIWRELKPSVVFLALHGEGGEDGRIQDRLEELGLRYTGCDPASSRLAFDKVASKRRMESADIPTPHWGILSDVLENQRESFAFPAVVKPARSGSSIELFFVDTFADLSELPLRLDPSDYLVEEKIVGREFTVAILGSDALPIVEIAPKAGRYDYTNKYTAGGAEYTCPAKLDALVTRHMQEASILAFRELGCRDYARIDFMLRGDSEFYMLEVNTLPGMTETSLFPKAAVAAGMSFEEVCEEMIRMAWER